MAYQVLARKWRPQRFSEVVGQEHITRTLQNAIMQERVGHAYLFVGPRGTGKTTTARIFAKTLNCEAGKVAEPCCQCQSCLQIAAGNSLDLIEIDGASHNGVNDIRELRENVVYTPSRSRYKIYIIDEVHMLSTQAWNALLKTLEEPPPHVKFLFATTEPRKVLQTILSRCQRFDLKRIPVPLIVDRLAEIAASEGVRVEDQALAAIARAADGGMRDGQSIFDQMIAFCGTDSPDGIRESDIIDVFGLASGSELRELAEHMLNNDLTAAIREVNGLADRGRDLERVCADLILCLRNIMLLQLLPGDGAAACIEAAPAETVELRRLAAAASQEAVHRLLDGLLLYEGRIRNALNKRVYLEASLARIIRDSHAMQIDDLIAGINSLRAQAGGGQLPPPPDTEKKSPRTAEPPRVTTPPPAASKPAPASPAPAPAKTASIAGVPVQKPAVAPNQPPATAAESKPAPATATPAPAAAAAPDKGKTADAAAPGALLHKLLAEINLVPGSHRIKTCLQELRPVDFADGILTLAYDSEFPEEHARFLQQPENRQVIDRCFARLCPGRNGTVLVKLWIENVSDETKKSRISAPPEVRAEVEKRPFVREVCDLFGASVVDVRGY